jgi:hypothetical protein
LSNIAVSDIMSKMMYVELETKKKEIPVHKPLTTNHGTLFTIVIVVGISALIGVGFAYMGYTSGQFSEAYVLCKENILSQVSVGLQSADTITAALESCDGVTG